MTTRIIFIALNVSNKNKILCDLAEKLYLRGEKIVIKVADSEEGQSYDRLLWTWKQSSFVPHSYYDKLDRLQSEGIIITSEIIISEGYDTLILSDSADVEILKSFTKVIDFAEKYNQSALVASRKRYKEYRDQKFEIETYQVGEFLHQLS